MMEKETYRVKFPPLGVGTRSLMRLPLTTSRKQRETARKIIVVARKRRDLRHSEDSKERKAEHSFSKVRQSLSNLRPIASHYRFFSSEEVSPVRERGICPWQLSDISFKQCLGKGATGQVLLSEVRSSQFAIKIIPKIPDKIFRIANAEKTVLSHLSHPLIVAYYGSLEDEKQVYIAMEYLPRGDLFHLMRRKRLKWGEIRFVASEIAAVMGYLHGENVVYRDLKPENVMIHGSGHVRLIDFGFAKKIVGERTRSILGSPEYMAPEEVMKKPHGLPVDCWSFGIFLYELAANHPPFQGSSPLEVYENIIQGQYELPSYLDAPTKDLIRKALNPEPRFRPTINDIKEHQFFQGVRWDLAEKGELPTPKWEELLERRKKEEFRTDLFDEV